MKSARGEWHPNRRFWWVARSKARVLGGLRESATLSVTEGVMTSASTRGCGEERRHGQIHQDLAEFGGDGAGLCILAEEAGEHGGTAVLNSQTDPERGSTGVPAKAGIYVTVFERRPGVAWNKCAVGRTRAGECSKESADLIAIGGNGFERFGSRVAEPGEVYACAGIEKAQELTEGDQGAFKIRGSGGRH